MLPNPSPMQAAFINAAVGCTKSKGKLIGKVIKAADRIKLREEKPSVKLSYRTAMKLKAEGVIE